MREIKPLITGVWQYGGNVHIAYRHIVKHQNVSSNAKPTYYHNPYIYTVAP